MAKGIVLSAARGIFLFLIYINYNLSSDSYKQCLSSHLLLNAESLDCCFCSILLTPACFSSFLPGQNKDLNQKWQQQVKYCECIFNLEKPSLRTRFYMFFSQNKLQEIRMHLLFPPDCSGLCISFHIYMCVCICVRLYIRIHIYRCIYI